MWRCAHHPVGRAHCVRYLGLKTVIRQSPFVRHGRPRSSSQNSRRLERKRNAVNNRMRCCEQPSLRKLVLAATPWLPGVSTSTKSSLPHQSPRASETRLWRPPVPSTSSGIQATKRTLCGRSPQPSQIIPCRRGAHRGPRGQRSHPSVPRRGARLGSEGRKDDRRRRLRYRSI
jgi:hypothetical protein